MLKHRIVWLFLLFMTFTVGGQAASQPVGHVVVVSGPVIARSDAGETRELRRKSPVFEGDTVVTGNHAIQIRFTDGSLTSLRKGTEFKVEAFNWSGQEDGSEKGFFSLLKGGLRTLTGSIGKANKDRYNMATPVATIGIRGTFYQLRLCENDCGTDSQSGLFGGVSDGGIRVVNDAGSRDFSAGDFFKVEAGNALAKTLLVAPEFLHEPDYDAVTGEYDEEEERERGEGVPRDEEREEDGRMDSEDKDDQDDPRDGKRGAKDEEGWDEADVSDDEDDRENTQDDEGKEGAFDDPDNQDAQPDRNDSDKPSDGNDEYIDALEDDEPGERGGHDAKENPENEGYGNHPEGQPQDLEFDDFDDHSEGSELDDPYDGPMGPPEYEEDHDELVDPEDALPGNSGTGDSGQAPPPSFPTTFIAFLARDDSAQVPQLANNPLAAALLGAKYLGVLATISKNSDPSQEFFERKKVFVESESAEEDDVLTEATFVSNQMGKSVPLCNPCSFRRSTGGADITDFNSEEEDGYEAYFGVWKNTRWVLDGLPDTTPVDLWFIQSEHVTTPEERDLLVGLRATFNQDLVGGFSDQHGNSESMEDQSLSFVADFTKQTIEDFTIRVELAGVDTGDVVQIADEVQFSDAREFGIDLGGEGCIGCIDSSSMSGKATVEFLGAEADAAMGAFELQNDTGTNAFNGVYVISQD